VRALLRAAEDAGFVDVLVTGDRTLEYEQNLSGRAIAVVALSANNWKIIKNHIPTIAVAIDTAPAGMVTRVEAGAFVRRKRDPGPALG
jgi:hypothetical protein